MVCGTQGEEIHEFHKGWGCGWWKGRWLHIETEEGFLLVGFTVNNESSSFVYRDYLNLPVVLCGG